MRPVKKWVKSVLDIVIFLLLMLMYRKQAIGMAFHEIGGLALLALFIVHHVLNGAWIAAVTRKLFSRQTPVRTRVSYCVDALLIVAVLCIGVSGALISKTVFSFGVHGGGWKTLHYFCAALALILGGVHVGLHAQYLFGGLRKRNQAVRVAAAVLLAVILVFGVYSLTTTSFIRWLGMPFSSMSSEGPGPDEGKGFGAQGEAEEPSVPSGDSGSGAHGRGQGGGPGKGAGSGSDGKRLHGTGRGGGGFSVMNALTVLAQFTSIAAVFAAITYGVERLFRRKKQLALQTA